VRTFLLLLLAAVIGLLSFAPLRALRNCIRRARLIAASGGYCAVCGDSMATGPIEPVGAAGAAVHSSCRHRSSAVSLRAPNRGTGAPVAHGRRRTVPQPAGDTGTVPQGRPAGVAGDPGTVPQPRHPADG
jgi:hypothetical protein